MNKSIEIKEFVLKNRDIFTFVLVIIATHLFWKYSINYNINDLASFDITWFGIDISRPFIMLSQHIASAVYWFLSLFYDKLELVDNIQLIFPNQRVMQIAWVCSGLKQMFIFFMIIVCAQGSWLQKLWFIPFGLLVCHIYNIIRITFLGWLVESQTYNVFDFFHEYITKYIFYGIIFLLWVWWNKKAHLTNKK